MNPKDWPDCDDDDDFMFAADIYKQKSAAYNEQEALIAKMRQDLKDREREEQAERSKRVNQAYADLCDALGVQSLNASIDGDSGHVRIPVASIETAVARINSLRTNVLAEGAL